ncbi:MAG: hypothetical protein AB7F88_01035 [Pyrinomonadaceae bacterium]
MSFCLSDGTPLVALLDEPDEATVVRSGRSHKAAETAAGTGIGLKVLAAAIVLLLGFMVLGGVTLWIFWPRDGVVVTGNGTPNNNSKTPTPTATRTAEPSPTQTVEKDDQANIRSQQEELERERKRLEDERRRLEEEKRNPPDTPAPPPTFNDPGTTRIKFRRGRVGETVSGTVGRQRSFALRTLAGQYLSSTVRSPGGCVTFTDGGSSTGYPTRTGDSFLTIRNNCDTPSRFSLSVSVR